MRPSLSKSRQFLILVVVNGVIIFTLLYGFEAYLRLTDPFLNLPFDSFYYGRYADYYPHLKAPTEVDYTWGHPVINNRLGFREREFETPKPAGLCRVMVLGDSLTWGVGLDPSERYTQLAETYLNEQFPGQKFEVLNFGVSGLPTTTERDILQAYKDLVGPDLVVVGFTFNDPQPKSMGYVLEKEQFNRKYGDWLNLGPQLLFQLGLPQLARLSQKVIADKLLVAIGLVPPWQVGLQRTYDPTSSEWLEFKQALQEIRAMSDEMQLPPPIFAVLNSDIYLNQPTAPTNLDETLPIYLRWYHQARQTAEELGFVAYDHEAELIEQLQPGQITINELDAHPSARVNQIYAQKLFEAIAAYLRSGQLCLPAAPQIPQPALSRSLVAQRLMRIRMGGSIRFLGYVTSNPQTGRGETLSLKFGWQALTPIQADYTVRITLVAPDGRRLAEWATRPCHNDCPTVQWPPGMVVPPGSATIYWPTTAQTLPLPFDSIFKQSHLAARDSTSKTVALAPVPLSLIPFPGSLVDEHRLDFSPNLPPGEYTLVMSLRDSVSDEPLPAYDEVAQENLPGGDIILGQIIIK